MKITPLKSLFLQLSFLSVLSCSQSSQNGVSVSPSYIEMVSTLSNGLCAGSLTLREINGKNHTWVSLSVLLEDEQGQKVEKVFSDVQTAALFGRTSLHPFEEIEVPFSIDVSALTPTLKTGSVLLVTVMEGEIGQFVGPVNCSAP